ncbi:rhamnulokinase family protein [Thermoanaerobacterium sp. RBIITD]|uniref:rhamnulokinase n=1 Tax=Thermoanaerobacterium sp. RBIITD TaxID=1550240 RepID=UPI000BB8CA48|nr:rhamnulokinase family protein [Thermoanaerobacterium sp. RBIITD]SNX53408.1 rhamnulokinase [Thermoanaerobacterium sp. RBIITD]
MKDEVYNLSFDFGASNGRLMLSKFDGEKITLEEVYRFQNEPVRMGRTLYWDFLRLFHELKNGLKLISKRKIKISSIGIDTWGVDYGLLDKNDQLISNPVHYRDQRTNGIIKDVEKILPLEEIYNVTGIQFMEFNTIFQLYCDLTRRPELLNNARTLLFIPDLFNFYLTHEKYNEYTVASTSQMLDAEKKDWAIDLIKKLNLPEGIFQKILMPGNIIGYLTKEIREETGLSNVPVISVGSHDTASAVAGTPLESSTSAYLSCGTWSLLGIESDHPLINEYTKKYNFTNEGGVEGYIRLLKNINGLWIIQQLKQSWNSNGIKIGFSEISQIASKSKHKEFIINPDDRLFMAPDNMVEAIKQYCIQTGQGLPQDMGDIARAAYNGIVEQYKNCVNHLEEITGKNIDTIQMVGGGIQDKFLCKLTADITGKTVVTGPIEASVYGNSIVQLIGLGFIKDLKEGRKIIKNSIEQERYSTPIE